MSKTYDPIVHLYYHSKKLCRTDCDTLGISRKRLITIYGPRTMVFQDSDGNQFLPGMPPVERQMVAKIKVRQSLIDKAGLENLHHDDDETWS